MSGINPLDQFDTCAGLDPPRRNDPRVQIVVRWKEYCVILVCESIVFDRYHSF